MKRLLKRVAKVAIFPVRAAATAIGGALLLNRFKDPEE